MVVQGLLGGAEERVDWQGVALCVREFLLLCVAGIAAGCCMGGVRTELSGVRVEAEGGGGRVHRCSGAA